MARRRCTDKIAIFGAAGAIGRNVANQLVRCDVPFRAVGRRREVLDQAFGELDRAEIFPADLDDPIAAQEAAVGVDAILYAVGVPYTNFSRHPILMRRALAAAVHARVPRMMVVSSVYSYGVPETPQVSETHPRHPRAFKGLMRKEQEDLALRANEEGRIRTMVVRLPDFYGPHATQSLAHEVFSAALAGKTANWLGPLEKPREFLYVPDAAAVIVDLFGRDDAWGRAWNVGGAGTIDGGDFVHLVFQAAGSPPKVRTIGKGMLRLLGIANPLMKELVEMQYLAETPVILDDSRLLALLGELPKTPYREGIEQTVEWYRSNAR